MEIAATGLPNSLFGRWIPILLSSLLFALAHGGQGAAPFALFLLALGVGYVYQQTHRLLPCLVIHFLVNFTAIFQLGMEVANHRI